MMAWGRGFGRVYVFLADALALGADGGLESFARGCEQGWIVCGVGGFEPFPRFAREFSVDRQEGFPAVTGKADGELDGLQGVGLDADVAQELGGSEHLLEKHAELDLGKGAAGFDVGEDARQAVDPLRQL